ncbi:uncharacterized protein LOC141628197 [Silene latifolia]|uniref:uncharacterized protein LOC141628197 n=1 Tax=Silene latifolia TaxID=37657 RepID=UPI003D77BEA4
MILYLEYAKKLCDKFISFDIEQIPRDLNTQADAFASLGTNFTPAVFNKIPIVHILEPAIIKPEQASPVNTDNDSWTKPYYDWFLRGILPQGRHEARAFKIRASSYFIINNTLFKRSQAGPYLRCLEPHEAKQWGMDIVGKFPVAPGQKVFMLAMTDYFSKWIEANSFRQVTEQEVISFIRTNIICRWIEELPLVLWADRTTPKTSTGHTSHFLVYGYEAVILAEVYVPTSRYSLNNIEANTNLMRDNLVLIEELRDSTKVRMGSYQQTVAKSYNKNVKIIVFREGDLVLRKVFPNKKEKSAGKLAPAWEGPYLIDSIVGQGAYMLQTLQGEMIPRSWNVTHLKLFHI